MICLGPSPSIGASSTPHLAFARLPGCICKGYGGWYKRVCFVLFVLAGLFLQSSQPLQANPVPLYLEVYINGYSTNLIAAFKRHDDGRFSTPLSELKELGIKLNHARNIDNTVFLSDINGLAFRYEEQSQKIYIDTENGNRLARNYSANGSAAGGKEDRKKITKSDFGAVVNYSVNASGDSGLKAEDAEFSGVSTLLDARIFGTFGVLSSSFLIDSDTSENAFLTRLETNWSYTDEERLLTYTIGDIITGGPSWSRPTRLGGVRVSRNFSIRPDLVTQPVANVSGSAAVPSTVDVYVRNVKAHSQNVASGPFVLSNIPSINGNGTARIVVRDATGRETVTYSDFFLSPQLLAAGFWDFSTEIGVARGNFAENSFNYGRDVYFSGSARYGWNNKATLDGHVETGLDLLMVGGGVTFPFFNKALISLSGASSFHKNEKGFLAAVSLETTLFGLTINGRSQRSFGNFNDIAAVTADDLENLSTTSQALLSAAEFPTAIDQISIGVPFPQWDVAFNTSYIHTNSRIGEASNILSASVSKKLWESSSLYATAFADLKNWKSPTFFVGFSMPLGNKSSISTGGTYNKNQGWRASATYSKPLDHEVGSVGWRIQDQEGSSSVRNAAVSYRASAATLEARVSQAGDALSYSAYANGAIAFTQEGIFPVNKITDSFAVVDVGAPNVPVLFENKAVGKTNANGKLLIASLRSYEKNKITIDSSNLPVNANIPETSMTVRPAYRSGITVKFGVETATSSAVIIVHDRNGKPLTAGTAGKLGESQIDVIAGFDGRIFIENLSHKNQIYFETKTGTCQVNFEFQANQETQVEIGPLICK